MAPRVLRGFVVILLLCSSAHAGGHVKGVSLAHVTHGGRGYGSDDCRQQLKKIAEVGGTWVSISDFAFMEAVDQPGVRHRFASVRDDSRASWAVLISTQSNAARLISQPVGATARVLASACARRVHCSPRTKGGGEIVHGEAQQQWR